MKGVKKCGIIIEKTFGRSQEFYNLLRFTREPPYATLGRLVNLYVAGSEKRGIGGFQATEIDAITGWTDANTRGHFADALVLSGFAKLNRKNNTIILNYVRVTALRPNSTPLEQILRQGRNELGRFRSYDAESRKEKRAKVAEKKKGRELIMEPKTLGLEEVK